MKINGFRSDKKKCIVCGHKTGKYMGWAYVDGIEIDVPVCDDCHNKVGYCLDLSMDIHLKGILQSVRMSQIITCDELRLQELEDE